VLAGKIGIVIGTGPSLTGQIDDIKRLQKQGAKLFAVNNVFNDFDLTDSDTWIACDPAWHRHYGKVEGPFQKYHWDKRIANEGGYEWIEGRWFDGISPPGSDWLSLNHGSGPQALNLAVLAGCDPILLAGCDMHYNGTQRHYFDDLSETPGEYPGGLRKVSPFEKPKREGGAHKDGDGILFNYKHIQDQVDRGELPCKIYNATPGSAMTWFPFVDLADY